MDSRVRGLAIVTAVIAASFALGAVLHAGVGVGPLAEPRIVGAAVVEALCALVFAAATLALAAGRRGQGRLVRIAHAVGIGGVLLGILTLDLDLGPRTLSNDLYHLAVLVTMLLTLRYYERRIEARPSARAGATPQFSKEH